MLGFNAPFPGCRLGRVSTWVRAGRAAMILVDSVAPAGVFGGLGVSGGIELAPSRDRRRIAVRFRHVREGFTARARPRALHAVDSRSLARPPRLHRRIRFR